MANYQQVTLPFCTPVPFNFPLTGHEDCLIQVKGFAGNTGPNIWFCINVQSAPGLPSCGPSMGGDVLLHLRPDFTNQVVVRMNRMMGNWGPPNQPDSNPFPLIAGSPFEIMILLPASSVSVPSVARIAINGNHFAEYALPSVLPPSLFLSIEADPNVTIASIQSFNIPSQAPPPQSAGYPNLAAAPHPMPVPNFPGQYPPGGAMPTPGAGYATGQPSSSNSMFNKVLGTAAALPLVGGALAAATHLPFAGKKLGKKMHKAGLGGGGHKSSGGFGYPGLGTGAAGLAVGALGAYALTKKAKKLKKGFKFGHSSSSSSSSDSD